MNLSPVIKEAVRELNIKSEPDMYHRLRSWLRKNIKHQTVTPLDMINWPKGCLMTGLVNQSVKLRKSDSSPDRALSVLAMSEVKEYLDEWIRKGSPIYFLDDALAGQALLMLLREFSSYCSGTNHDSASMYSETVNNYRMSADNFAAFLKAHDKDFEGALPYRPAHKNNRIFADGIGMAMPYMFMYGVLFEDEDMLESGLDQLRGFMKHGIDSETGLPWHVYSLGANCSTTDMNASSGQEALENGYSENMIQNSMLSQDNLGAVGWGRAAGWIIYGIETSIEALETWSPLDKVQKNIPSVLQLTALKELKSARSSLIDSLLKYRRDDGSFGSIIADSSTQPDSSATAMILCGYRGEMQSRGISSEKISEDVSRTMEPFIDETGRVTGAQSECMDLGVYGMEYSSYPWSVGMTLML